MDWLRHYHGEVCDPRWLGIAREAGNGVTPGHVYVVWSYLKESASRASPRGIITRFDASALADFTGWPLEQITGTVDAICARGLIVDGVIVDWLEKQPVKLDATNADRQKRHRAKAKKLQDESRQPQSMTNSNGVTDVTGNDVTTVTTTEEKEHSKCSFSDSSEQDTNSSLKLDTPRSVREQARAFINVGEIWAWIAAAGIPANIGTRTFNRQRIAGWLQQGLTDQHLAEAMKRAQKRRADDNSTAPVNLGFLACLADEVLSGAPMKTTTGGGHERGDQLSREFADVR
ncbi:hypothetical protein EAH75_04215 [Rhodanobacter glycinis]|uniref:hypothetical protein n=1 Tax=Rhodanobacter glycinis TaxID=582702 RepID=UPI001128F3D8|nr:hypothetical protein [Rhodanobacter glycinis]TPG50649.1 hypothetical protein EAH75_04215 [Rhodanobacter glycinis]